MEESKKIRRHNLERKYSNFRNSTNAKLQQLRRVVTEDFRNIQHAPLSSNVLGTEQVKFIPKNVRNEKLSPGSKVNLLAGASIFEGAKSHRRKRSCSTIIVKRHHRGSDADCRTVVMKRKRSKYLNSGINAPPRHVHCNDWREMVNLTENRAIHKSESNLAPDYIYHNSKERVNFESTNSLGSIRKASQDALKPKLNYLHNNQQEVVIENREKAEIVARLRCVSGGSTVQHDWIEQTFCKRECAVFISSSKDSNKCGCGKVRNVHSMSALSAHNSLHYNNSEKKLNSSEKWSISRHTVVSPTDAYGTIEFQGGPHPFKAQYLRLNFDTDSMEIMTLFEHVWQMAPPKLIITVHGGITNFDLQPKLARVFRKGLLKAARTTGAWIFTSGINAGVVRHVAAALEGAISSSKNRAKIITVGISPWGLLRKREDLLGRDKVVSYHTHCFPPKGRFAVLNNRSSFFLLVDNGTVGRYGADIILRRRLESYIAEKQKIGNGGRSVPVVCVVLEGGTCTVRTVLDYVTRIPRVPVVVCDGSGRASDLLAFAHQYIQEDGNLPEGIRPQLLSLIEAVFSYDKINAQCLVIDILACVRQKHMITIFRLGENQKQDVDYAILTALLKGQNLSPAEQLSLALAWNRVDIARSDIFIMGQDWANSALHNAMMEALIYNRVDFVRLLLENGVSMHDFLTIGRLEELYNTDQGPPNTLYYIVRDVVKIRPGYHYKLIHIGMAIEKLMANGFRSHYTSSEFRLKYSSYRNKCREVMRSQKSGISEFKSNVDCFPSSILGTLPQSSSMLQCYLENEASHVLPAISGSRALSNHILWRSAYRRDNFITPSTLHGTNLQQKKDVVIDVENEFIFGDEEKRRDFKYPFSDLLIWAVLTKRHEMALCMWQHGEEAMAKALVACRLYKSLAKEAAEDYLEVEICEELKKYAEEFRLLSLELLDHCYKQDDAQTLQLLTYELVYWGYETCLSLAVIVNNKQFLAHPCCQILLADLWHGGLRIRSNSNLKVILGILLPPSIFFLEFKSREELMLQPQTAAEHEHDINDSSSSSSSGSSSSSSSSSLSETNSEDELSLTIGGRRRHPLSLSGGGIAVTSADGKECNLENKRNSSLQSLNLASLFHNKKKKRYNQQNALSTSVIKNVNSDGIELTNQPTLNLSVSNECNLNQKHSKKDEKFCPTSSFLSAKVSEVMALSSISVLGAVSSPTTAASLSNCSCQNISAYKIKNNEHFSNNDKSGAIEKMSKDIINEKNEHVRNLFAWPQPENIPTDSTVGENKTTLSAPCFTIGYDDDDERSTLSNNVRSSLKPLNVREGSLSHSNPLSDHNVADYCHLNDQDNINDKQNTKNSFNNFVKKPPIVLSKGITLPTSLTFNRRRQIKLRRKIYEFFVAPITTFWAWTLSFVVFLCALTYVLLIKTPLYPTFVEWYLLAYVVTFALETARKFFMSEPKKFKEKVEYFLGNYWNIITLIAIIGFLIGFSFRIYPLTRKTIGRVVLAVNSVLWSIKLLDFLGVHPRFGPYITMAAKMVMNMSSIVVMLVISLLAFGLARQSITFPDEDWHWLLLRNVFYKPYFMLYGEVYADEIDTCGDEAWDEHFEKKISITETGSNTSSSACVPGHWIPPLLMTAFLLIANILLISMLIAIFNNIFDQTIKISQQIWLFQRYRQVMEYEGTPFLPPPFTPIYHAFMIAKYLRYRNCCCFSKSSLLCIGRRFLLCCCCCLKQKKSTEKSLKNQHQVDRNTGQSLPHSIDKCTHRDNNLSLFDFSLKLFLSADQVEKLHDFEEECMDDMAREKEIVRNRSNEERLHRAAERTDLILTKLNDLTSKEARFKSTVRELDSRLELMESKQAEMMDCIHQVTSVLPAMAQALQNLSFGSSSLMHSNIQPRNYFSSLECENIQSCAEYVELSSKNAKTSLVPDQNIAAPHIFDNRITEQILRKKFKPNDSLTTHVFSNSENNFNLKFKFDENNKYDKPATKLVYPLLPANSSSAVNMLIHRRARTTAGNEIDSAEFVGTTDHHPSLLGSLVSLVPTKTAFVANKQDRKRSSIRKRRRNEEYTSITDSIEVTDIFVSAIVPGESLSALDVPGLQSQKLTKLKDRRQPSLNVDNLLTESDNIFNQTEDDADVEDLDEYFVYKKN